MKTVLLEKIDVQKMFDASQEQENIVQVPDARHELAVGVREKLGYDFMLTSIKSDETKTAQLRTRRCKELEILQTLSGIGPDAAPYDPVSVEKYQKHMIEKDKPFFYRHGMSNTVSNNIAKFIGGICFASCVLVVIVAIVGFVNGFISHEWSILIKDLYIGLPIIVMLFVLMFPFIISAEYKSPGRWERRPLCGYKEQVPEFALATALSIKEQLPNAEFHVEYFLAGEKKPDPFLVMTLENITYYLEVWNEPNFNAKRIA